MAPARTVIAPVDESMSNTAPEVASSEYAIVSPALASVAVIVTTAVPPALFSATDAVVGWLVNTGATLASVAPLPVADQPLVPSALVARTCTSWVAPGVRPVIVVLVAVPSKAWTVQPVSVDSLYCTS